MTHAIATASVERVPPRRPFRRLIVGLVLSAAAVTCVSAVPSPAAAAVAPARKPPTPPKPPKGAKFLCKDGTYSFVKTAKTACVGHRGVQRAL